MAEEAAKKAAEEAAKKAAEEAAKKAAEEAPKAETAEVSPQLFAHTHQRRRAAGTREHPPRTYSDCSAPGGAANGHPYRMFY